MLKVIFTLFALYKPIHIMDTEHRTCGAEARMMREKIKVDTAPGRIKINNMEWNYIGRGDEGYYAFFQTRPDSYMSMSFVFTVDDAYLTIQGIDYKRRPCKDTVYLRRVR